MIGSPLVYTGESNASLCIVAVIGIKNKCTSRIN